MIPLKTVSDLISKHEILEKELSSAEIDKNTFAEKSKAVSYTHLTLPTILRV